MANVVEEFAAIMGWDVDDRQLKDMGETVDKTEKRIQKLGQVAKAVAGIIGGALFVGTNKATAETDALAESVGISTDLIRAMTHEVQIAGFGMENVVSMVEELNNKLGESKGVEEMTAVKEATEILGLSFEQLAKQTPEEQFRTLTDAMLRVEDQQKAVAAADILMGGESNRIIGIMRARGRTLAEIEERHRELNALTEDGREGATAFTLAWNDFTLAISSAWQQVAGLLGKALMPLLEVVTGVTVELAKWINSGVNKFLEQFNNWLRVIGITLGIIMAAKFIVWLNRLVITIRAAAAAFMAMNFAAVLIPALFFAMAAAAALLIDDLLTLQEGGDSLIGSLLEGMPAVLETFKGFLNGLGEVFMGMYNFLVKIGEIIGTTAGMIHISIANLIDFIMSIPSKISAIIDKVSGFASSLFAAVGQFFDDGTTVNGNVTGTLSAVGAAAGGGNTTNNNSIQMNITQQAGEDGQVFAERVASTINQQMARAVRNTNNGVEY